MMRTIPRALVIGLGFLAFLCVPASAAVLDIQFTGVDLVYDGSRLTDATNGNTVGTGAPSEADPLVSLTLLEDGALAGPVITTSIATDIYINGITSIPAAGGFVTSTGNSNSFGVDLLTQNAPNSAWGLALNIGQVNVAYSGGVLGMWAIGQATSVWTQALPYGLVIDTTQPVSFTFSSVLIKNVQSSNGFITHFETSGTGSVKATLVTPEPATVILLALGTLGLFRRRIR